MDVCCECCVSSGRGLCDGLITRPEESYRLWRVVVCDQETSNEEAKARYGLVKTTTKRVVTPRKQTNNINITKMVEMGRTLSTNGKGKGKVRPRTGHEGPERE